MCAYHLKVLKGYSESQVKHSFLNISLGFAVLTSKLNLANTKCQVNKRRAVVNKRVWCGNFAM